MGAGALCAPLVKPARLRYSRGVLPRPFGPYRLLRRLGQGGLAEVHLALAFGASGFEKRVAIKTLLPELRGDGACERLLIDEARLSASLQHRGLVQVHDLGVCDGQYFVRLEYIEGADLQALLRAGERPDPALCLLIAEELAYALDYVHRKQDDKGRPLGLVHRDVSPANVLLSTAGEIKLGDFGVAKATHLQDHTRAGVRKGKYAYMSPEQICGEDLTGQSDLFSLGVLLAELLVGRRPFDSGQGSSPQQTMERIRTADPADLASLSGLSIELGGLLRRCLARNPQDRQRSAAELGHALGRARRAFATVGPPELAAWVGRCLQGAPGPAAPAPQPGMPTMDTAPYEVVPTGGPLPSR